MNYYLLVTFIFFLSPTFAQLYNTSNSHAEVHGSAPLNSYTGKSDQLEGNLNLNDGKINFKIPIKSIDTGNDKRNSHMLEALEADRFPYASFTGKLATDFDPTNPAAQEVAVSGHFTIHGESKPIHVNGVLTPAGNSINFSSSWELNISEYGIKRPKILFYKVQDRHMISISGTLVK